MIKLGTRFTQDFNLKRTYADNIINSINFSGRTRHFAKLLKYTPPIRVRIKFLVSFLKECILHLSTRIMCS